MGPCSGFHKEHLGRCRRRRDWAGQLALCLDPTLAAALRDEAAPSEETTCSMCGDLCVFKIADDEEGSEEP